MEYKYIIDGNKKLNGTVNIKGSKNSSLAIIVASLLSKDKVVLKNVPDISDVHNLIKILKKLNCKVKYNGYSLFIDSTNLKYTALLMNEMKQLRASYYFMGAFLSLFNKVKITYPGGCKIGKRPIDIHLKGFESLNCKINNYQDYLEITSSNLKPNIINLSFPSVGATVNLILCSIFINGTTIIKNAAKEPEIADLIDFLNKMGANIIGKDSSVLLIKGVKKLHGCHHKIIPDRIEGGTYIIYAASLANKVTIKNIIISHQKALLKALIDANVPMDIFKNKITIYGHYNLNSIHIKTGPYPDFPTDLQQIMCTFMTKLNGFSSVEEKIFDNRYTHVSELNKMNAHIKIVDNKLLIDKQQLKANELICQDLRGGAALLLGCLLADGRSILYQTKYIDRGYQNIIENLNQLGAKIIKESEKNEKENI